MIGQVLALISGIAIIMLLAKAFLEYQKEVSKVKMSFKAGINKTQLPVVTFKNNDTEYNFLIDCGSTISLVEEKALKAISHTPLKDVNGSMYGIDGNVINVSYVKINLEYKDNVFTDAFQVSDIPGFDNIEKSDGIRLSGILGVSFLQKYKSQLDFDNLKMKLEK